MAKPGRTEPTPTQLAASTYRGRDTTDPAAGEEALLGRPDTGLPGDAREEEYQIRYHRIRIATPCHNGKVEHQHRIDQQRFYVRLRMFSLEDGRKQLAVYQKKSNDYIKHCLGLRSPNQVLEDYLAVM